jgi:hypothetical protein
MHSLAALGERHMAFSLLRLYCTGGIRAVHPLGEIHQMKTVNSKNACLATHWLWLLLLPLLTASTLDAQTVVAPISQVSTTPAALQEILGVKPDEAALDSALTAIATEPPIEFGPLKLLPHMFYRFLYGNGIQALPGHPSTTAINSFSPGLLVDFGKAWTFDYTPTWNIYSNHAFHNSTDQDASLTGVAVVHEWTLMFSQTYISTFEPNIETGMQTSEKDYGTALGATRELKPGVDLDTGFDEDLRYVVGYPEALSWSTTDWVDFQVAPTIKFGVGTAVGYVQVGLGSDLFYYSPQLRMTLNPSSKITVNVNAGVEHEDFQGQLGSSRNNPIYDLSVEYAPFTPTKLSITAGQAINTAFIADQTTQTQHSGVALEQRFLEHYFLSAGIDQTDVSYVSSVGAGSTVRRDRNLSSNVRLGTVVLSRVTLSVLYEAGKNTSSLPGYAYSTQQVGFEFGYRF